MFYGFTIAYSHQFDVNIVFKYITQTLMIFVQLRFFITDAKTKLRGNLP